MENNIKDIALVIEGGGMRGSFTAGIVNTLLEEKIYFDYVIGVSAGASNAVNYLSRDQRRVKRSFVEIVKDPKFGGMGTFIQGKGYFHSDYIYNYMSLEKTLLPYDYKTFEKNNAKLRIGAFQRDTGKMIYWTKKAVHDTSDLITMVRASSSLPVIMPPTFFRGEYYVDGGLGPNGGIPIDLPIKEGYKKFVIIKSRPKSYRKDPPKHIPLIRRAFRKYPHLVQAMEKRYLNYNKSIDLIEKLEDQGDAFIIYPKKMIVENNCRDFELLEKNYYFGRIQGKREIKDLKKFLEINYKTNKEEE